MNGKRLIQDILDELARLWSEAEERLAPKKEPIPIPIRKDE